MDEDSPRMWARDFAMMGGGTAVLAPGILLLLAVALTPNPQMVAGTLGFLALGGSFGAVLGMLMGLTLHRTRHWPGGVQLVLSALLGGLGATAIVTTLAWGYGASTRHLLPLAWCAAATGSVQLSGTALAYRHTLRQGFSGLSTIIESSLLAPVVAATAFLVCSALA